MIRKSLKDNGLQSAIVCKSNGNTHLLLRVRNRLRIQGAGATAVTP
jgi:hypothetical protein